MVALSSLCIFQQVRISLLFSQISELLWVSDDIPGARRTRMVSMAVVGWGCSLLLTGVSIRVLQDLGWLRWTSWWSGLAGRCLRAV